MSTIPPVTRALIPAASRRRGWGRASGGRLEKRVLFSAIHDGSSWGNLTKIENTPGALNNLTVSTPGLFSNYTFSDPGTTITLGNGAIDKGWVQSTASNAIGPSLGITSIFIDTNDLADQVRINSALAPVTFSPTNSNGATDSVFIGDGINALGVAAQVNLFNTSGKNDTTIYQQTSIANDPVLFSDNEITGLLPAPIVFDANSEEFAVYLGTVVRVVTVNQPNALPSSFLNITSQQADIINIPALAAGAYVFCEGANSVSATSINIGNGGSLLGVLGNVIVGQELATLSTVSVDGSSDTLGIHCTINDHGLTQAGATTQEITGLIGGTITLLQRAVQDLSIDAGSGNNQFTLVGMISTSLELNTGNGNDQVTVLSLPALDTLTIDTQNGVDSVNLGDSSTGLSAQSIAGHFKVTMPQGGAVKIDDGIDAIGRTVTPSDTTVLGLIPATITLKQETSVSVIGGSGADRFALTPKQTVSFSIDGGTFAPPALPLDLLQVDLTAIGAPVLDAQGSTSGEEGTYTFSDHQPVSFNRIGSVTPLIGSISGTVFSGLTGAALPAIKVFLDQNNNGAADITEAATATDSAGAYSFGALAPGTQAVVAQLPAGLVNGAGPGTAMNVSVIGGQQSVGDFAAFPAPTAGAADLVGLIVGKLPLAAIEGTKGAAKVRVTNQAAGIASGLTQVSLFLSANGTLDPSDTLVANSLPMKLNLRNHGSKMIQIPFTYPAIPNGSYVLLASVDSVNGIPESNETNNVAAIPTAISIAQPFVDLTSTFGKLRPSLKLGKSANFPLVITNLGNTIATGTDSRRYSSFRSRPDFQPGAPTPFCAKWSHAADQHRKPGRTQSLSIRSPKLSGTAGTFFLIANINSSQSLIEADFLNDLAISHSGISLS